MEGSGSRWRANHALHLYPHAHIPAQGVGTDRSPAEAAGELTGFFPRIDLIFSSSTSKRYLRGSGLGFRAEILGLGFGFRV